MGFRTGKSFLGLIAAGLMSVFGSRRIKHTTEDLKKAEFKASSQRLGIHFSDKIRDIFRFRWIKRKDH